MTQSQLARAVNMVQSHLSSIELGKKGTTGDQVKRLDVVLSAGGVLESRWQELHERKNGYADWFAGTAVLEGTATDIKVNSPLLVPGLFQTEGYARTIIRYGDRTATPADVEEQVLGRLERQKILASDQGPIVTVVLDESVLRRNLGGDTIMKAQIEHLIEISALPRTTIHVVEMSSEYQPGLDGTFHLFTVPDHGELVYTETRISGYPVDDPEAVQEYVGLFGELRGAALSPAASRELMNQIRREYDDVDQGLGQVQLQQGRR
ncbi:helix-turn-helix transcriptional regulator [Nocardiopsis mangrovi]|uniref:Helix-turn-helix transcriptional regulator n=1 Tax=Nocardiopsis mangrovi TaxID=1179818 RepID=A0ABV9DW36_9ACTN